MRCGREKGLLSVSSIETEMVSFAGWIVSSFACFTMSNDDLSNNNHNVPVAVATTATTSADFAATPAPRRPTFRTLSSTLSDQSRSSSSSSSSLSSAASKKLREGAAQMEQRAKQQSPLTPQELNDILNSIQNITPNDYDTLSLEDLRTVLSEIAHLSHKDWHVTDENAQRLGNILLQDWRIPEPPIRQMLERCLVEGNWDGATQHACQFTIPSSSSSSTPRNLPWAVLVTGVNGIRKTTSMYQPWFPKVLQEALVSPKATATTSSHESPVEFDVNMLPSGSNSFFRQLDHMIATLCNEDFCRLYRLTADLMSGDTSHSTDKDNQEISDDVIQQYTGFKAAIFTRYRTLSELLGVLLLREAQSLQMNCMMETSGRDVAMFHYVDHFFPTDYHKLALHFQINDLSLAKISVDARMVREIQTGMQAIASQDVFQVIYSNAGGPYGSSVLPGIQEESDRVWKQVVMSDAVEASVGKDWYKATIQINAYADRPWTAQAVKPDGSLGQVFEFESSSSQQSETDMELQQRDVASPTRKRKER